MSKKDNKTEAVTDPGKPVAVDETQPGTAVSTKTANTAVALVDDYGNDAGAGMEDVGREEYRIPFLRILQALSPACKPVSAGGIAGAKPGLIINTATQELIDPEAEPITFVPCFRDHNFVEFPPREGGGEGTGFQGSYEPDDPQILQLRAQQGRFGKLKRSNGNEISEVYYLYGIALIGQRSPIRCMVGFSGSQIKKYQAFMGQQMGIEFRVAVDPNNPDAGFKLVKPPIWAIRWRLTTVFESAKKGDYYNWQLTLAEADDTGRPSAIKSLIKKSDPLYEAGAAFNKLIQSGEAQVDYNNAAGAEDEAQARTNDTTTGHAGPVAGSLDEEIPF